MANHYLPAIVAISLSPLTAYAAEDPATTCREAAELYSQQDIDGALEEARWCLEALEQIKQGQISDSFPDEVAGFKGGEVRRQAAMGFTMIDRDYIKGGQMITVSLNNGGNGAGLGGMAAMAQMGMMGAGKKIRVQWRTVMDLSEGNRIEFIAMLKSGGMLRFESSNVDHADTLAFIKQFPIAELDQDLN